MVASYCTNISHLNTYMTPADRLICVMNEEDPGLLI